MKKLISSAVICIFFSVNLFAQQTSLLRELLDLPAPPLVAVSEDEDNKKSIRPAEFYDGANVPTDDAPIEDVFDYWKRKAAGSYYGNNKPPQISATNARRLLESFEREPENLKDFLKIFPADSATSEKVKYIFDVLQNAEGIDDDWRKAVREWLKFNSKFYIDELAAEVIQAKDHPTYNSVLKAEALSALARNDWEKAAPILLNLAENANQPITATYAKRLLYEYALKEKDVTETEKYRSQLIAVVENKNAKGAERDSAFDALVLNEDWRGRDDWYLSLFEDETLQSLRISENSTSSPLPMLAGQNPDKWIPILTKLVGNPNRNIHNAAVEGLMSIADDKPRRDALLPMIPLLLDSEWADISGQNWIGLVQWMGMADVPESVPSLIRLLETEEGTWRGWTARALAHYKDARAILPMRIALEKETEEDARKDIVAAIFESNGFTDDEQMSALEYYAEYITKPENRAKVQSYSYDDEENPLPSAVSIGKFLSETNESSEGLVLRTIERQKILQKKKPEVAKILSEIMAKWQGRLIDLEMLRKISSGEADVETIVGALARRKELKERVKNDLYVLRGKSGLTGGIAACLLDDENEILSAFHSQNLETQISALACARLLQKSLPVWEVGNYLNSEHQLLALAAERYLESEDSPESRRLVWAKHPNEALILGARDSFNPAKTSFSSAVSRLFYSVGSYGSYLLPDRSNYTELDKYEDKLREEIIKNENLLEIYTIVPSYAIRVYKDRTVVTWYEDDSRYYERVLKNDELADFRRFIAESEIENSPPVFGYCHYTCGMFEFVHLNRNGGRRFFGYTDFSAFMFYFAHFQGLIKHEDTKLHYYLQDKVDGLEVLFADEKFPITAIWKDGADFRLLVENIVREDEIDNQISEQNKIENDNKELDYEQREKIQFKRKAEREFEHFEWWKFANGKLVERIDEPVEIPFLRNNLPFPSIEDFNSNKSIWQSRNNQYLIRTGRNNIFGLWKVNRGEMIRLGEGIYENPFVSSDGNWTVATKVDWDKRLDSIVRANLQTGKEYRINIAPADEFDAVARVPGNGKILLLRDKIENRYQPIKNNPSPETPEYYLLDAQTGKTELVKGEFRPLVQQTFRPLQTTGNANEFWAAIYDKSKNQTVIGRYDAKNFAMKTVLIVPEIELDSMNIWVDEREAKVYFIYKGSYFGESHLLSLPLSSEIK